MDEKKKEIIAAVAYCRENNCKGYKAISALNLQYCKDARTINAHLERDFEAGKERQILTDQEERCLVRFLINKNRACQGLNASQVSVVVLNILRVQNENNRRFRHGGWEKKTPLSESAKQALNKVKKSFPFLLSQVKSSPPRGQTETQTQGLGKAWSSMHGGHGN